MAVPCLRWGQNARAARFAGDWPSKGRAPITYGLCGMLGGLDGALLAGYFRGANVDIGNEYLLSSIAVVVDRRHVGRGGQGQRAGYLGVLRRSSFCC